MKTRARATPPEAPLNCDLCPRLFAFRSSYADCEPTWFNAPVPSFGPQSAELLIVGLAPGLKGANRTGRPFTGDYAGDLLYATLAQYGFSSGTYSAHIDDNLELKNCMITNAVRCVPPQNKPTPLEIKTCRPFFESRIAQLPNLKVLLALGRIAHDQVLDTLQMRKKDFPFVHAAVHDVVQQQDDAPPRAFKLIDSFHCSRYNTNTGRLTPEMFQNVFAKIKNLIA
ncbi:MAG: uracil-DNA glycosylase [Pseudomonadota bacterium]